MKSKFQLAALAAAVLLAGTVTASAQSSTDRNGNATGSQHVGNGMKSTPKMKKSSHATTGMSKSKKHSKMKTAPKKMDSEPTGTGMEK
jgi:hypothetical protein